MSVQLNEKEAYNAMFEYLVSVYTRTKSDDLGGLLGGMSTVGDCQTADPAVWHDWLKCIQKAKQNEIDTSLEIYQLSYVPKKS